MADYNATDDWRWQWTKMGYEDPGWHTGDGADTVTVAKAGPVRIVIQTKSAIGYNGPFGKADELKSLKTFTIYNDIRGIHRNLGLVGKGAEAAQKSMTDYYGGPLVLASKFVDHGMNTSVSPWNANEGSLGFNTIYSPNDPGLADNDSRWQNNSDIRKFNLSEVNENWFAMYNASTMNGFIVHWGHYDYLDTLTSIDWSDGEIDVKYSLENFPFGGFDTILIPLFGDTTSDWNNLNGNWTIDYKIDLTSFIREPWISTTYLTETETETERKHLRSKLYQQLKLYQLIGQLSPKLLLALNYYQSLPSLS
ncbi:MAG: hypothetical protein ACXAD7_25640 [Candidatus Kariarchaeaceae archaeon]